MIYGILLCAVASLATGLGGLVVLCTRCVNCKTLAISQGFAAGVMIGISLLDMLPKSFAFAKSGTGTVMAVVVVAALFGIGCVAAVVLEKITCAEQKDKNETGFAVKKSCLVTMIVIVLHNLPEGMLTALTALSDVLYGAQITFAVAMHNIPEGIAVASGVLYVTKSKTKAVLTAFLTGVAELFGGVVALLLLQQFVTQSFIMAFIAVISGVMVQISVFELVPGGIKIYSPKAVLKGFVAGVITIALGICAF